MELNDLKKAWGKVSESNQYDRLLHKEEIRLMAQRRGRGILSKLERNVQIGFWFLGLFLLLTLVDELFPYERFLPIELKYQDITPLPLKLLGLVVNLIIMLTFVFFVIRYRRLKVHSLAAENLKDALKKVLILLDTFKREFYFALTIFTVAEGISFLLGVWTGANVTGSISTLKGIQIFFIITFSIICLAIFVAIIFYLFHLGFNSLYGKYRVKITMMLSELEEPSQEEDKIREK